MEKNLSSNPTRELYEDLKKRFFSNPERFIAEEILYTLAIACTKGISLECTRAKLEILNQLNCLENKPLNAN